MRALLQYTMLPTYVRYEGQVYGVWDVLGGPEGDERERATRRLQYRADVARQMLALEERDVQERRERQQQQDEILNRRYGRTWGPRGADPESSSTSAAPLSSSSSSSEGAAPASPSPSSSSSSSSSDGSERR